MSVLDLVRYTQRARARVLVGVTIIVLVFEYALCFHLLMHLHACTVCAAVCTSRLSLTTTGSSTLTRSLDHRERILLDVLLHFFSLLLLAKERQTNSNIQK